MYTMIPMSQRWFPAVILSLVLVGMTVAQTAASSGVGPGARLFFTQCYPGDPTAEDFRQLADAGFTVVVRPTDIYYPERNSASLKAMPAHFRMAADAGLDAAIFQGGMIQAEGRGTKRAGRDGKSSPYLPAHSEAGWRAMGDTLVAWAKVSLENRNFRFVGLDFEQYLGGLADVPGYSESYDTETFRAFFQFIAKPVPDPLPAPDKLYEYLDTNKLVDAYIEFQRQELLRQVQNVRSRIDEVNPRFQVGAYGYGKFFSTVLEGLATQTAPAIELDAWTYARGAWDPALDNSPNGSGYSGTVNRPDRQSLKWSLTFVNAQCRPDRTTGFPPKQAGWPDLDQSGYAARQRGCPVVFLAGHWPQTPGPADGTQYRFTVRQAFNSAAYGNGYWIWTEEYAPKPWTSIHDWTDAMVAYFGEANAALDAGDFTWSNRQQNAIPDPNATEPLAIVTFAGRTGTLWNPITGERVGESDSAAGRSPAQTNAQYGENRLCVCGSAVELIEPKTDRLIKQFPAGHGVKAVAVGDVDGIAGDEIVTLGAGFVRIWDPESGAELLRFRVGSDQTGLALERPKTPRKGTKL